jgi:hypothetical protein
LDLETRVSAKCVMLGALVNSDAWRVTLKVRTIQFLSSIETSESRPNDDRAWCGPTSSASRLRKATNFSMVVSVMTLTASSNVVALRS